MSFRGMEWSVPFVMIAPNRFLPKVVPLKREEEEDEKKNFHEKSAERIRIESAFHKSVDPSPRTRLSSAQFSLLFLFSFLNGSTCV